MSLDSHVAHFKCNVIQIRIRNVTKLDYRRNFDSDFCRMLTVRLCESLCGAEAPRSFTTCDHPVFMRGWSRHCQLCICQSSSSSKRLLRTQIHTFRIIRQCLSSVHIVARLVLYSNRTDTDVSHCGVFLKSMTITVWSLFVSPGVLCVLYMWRILPEQISALNEIYFI